MTKPSPKKPARRKRSPGGLDWAKVDALTDAEIVVRAKSDPDNPPRSKAQLSKMRRVALAKFVRQKLGMSQETFAGRFGIPLGTLRDWEQHRSEPDQANMNYLRVILANPKVVAKVVEHA